MHLVRRIQFKMERLRWLDTTSKEVYMMKQKGYNSYMPHKIEEAPTGYKVLGKANRREFGGMRNGIRSVRMRSWPVRSYFHSS